MPIDFQRLLLTKLLVDRENIPFARQRQLMLVGGMAPFPMGALLAQFIARREASNAAYDRARPAEENGHAGRVAALAAAAAEADAAAAAAETAQEAAEVAGKVAIDAKKAAKEAAEIEKAIRQAFEDEEPNPRAQ